MKEYTGKYASCKVFADTIEETAEEQIKEFLDCPAFEGAQIRIMPDVHAGAGAVIGFTAPVGDKVIPNVIGVDIGCGVLSQAFDAGSLDSVHFSQFDKLVRSQVPSGFAVRETVYPRMKQFFPGDCLGGFVCFQEDVDDICSRLHLDHGRVWRSIGSLGGGNHFIEIGHSEQEPGQYWLTIHSGSRNFGLQIANAYQNMAVEQMGKRGGLEWLTGDDAQSYLRDMRTAQIYASLNRLCILASLGFVPIRPETMVESVHNFIGDDDIIRKGAISAKAGELVVIPWNMRDGLIIGEGKGNEDWNNSAPHGAGRIMGRKQAKRTLDTGAFLDTMRGAGVWSTCVGDDTLDESPDAYKDHGSVLAALADSVAVTHTVRPVYSFKASKAIYGVTLGVDDE